MGTTTPVFSFEATTRDLAGLPDARGDSVKYASLKLQSKCRIRESNLGYQVRANLSPDEAERTVYDLLQIL